LELSSITLSRMGPVSLSGRSEVMGVEEAAKMLSKAPHFKKWHEALTSRSAVQRVMKNPDLNS